MKKTKAELNDTELEKVSGGDVTSANIVGTVKPHRRPEAEIKAFGTVQPGEGYVTDAAPTADEIISELRS